MTADVSEARGHLPRRRRIGVVGQTERDVVIAQQIKDRLLVPACMAELEGGTAVRMTSVEHLGSSPRARQQFERAKALLGWHLLVLPCTYTLSTAQLVLLLQTYLHDAEERAKIGTAAELARLRTALQITGG